MDLKDKIKSIQQDFELAINASKTLDEVEATRVQFFGKKGFLTSAMKDLQQLSGEARALVGKEANFVRQAMFSLLEEKHNSLEAGEINEKLKGEAIDSSLPGRAFGRGSIHPINKMMGEIKNSFTSMGFDVVSGPEIETVFRNFDALNTPSHHPSRAESDTFYFEDGDLLRTHTTSVQVRCLENKKPPIVAISPGKVYRPDYDATHTPMFHQVDGIFITDKDASFANLKAVLDTMIINVFPGVKTRFRPHFFPFTEPSAEMDMSCPSCAQAGCRLCKKSGWIEVLGCGMVSPEVLKHFGYTIDYVRGFAFGMGVERLAMIKYGIRDLRSLYENDLRLLKQFEV